MYFEKINSPDDIKKLNVDELGIFADEVRTALINKLSNCGGHIGPNLGMVEMTIALHYVFNSPVDKIVYDVSHQSYVHKMLTGRKEAFLNPDKYSTITGYTNPLESNHDVFTIGHTSTSISLASGLAKGRDVSGGKENIIAVIGDGSLSGGEALEGLNCAAELNSNFIIIVNDNDQSIAENHGGLYSSLKKLRETDGKASENIFKAMGLDYYYLDDGHDMKKLTELFKSVKDSKQPVVLHIHTIKGKGLDYAEKHREQWHYSGPFNINDGSSKYGGYTTGSTVRDTMVDFLKNNKNAVAITAGTPDVIKFSKEFRDKFQNQFVDVGIAEEQAVAMASGIAKNGGIPVFSVFSSFLQRTYDQLSSDLCLNNSPAVIQVFAASVYGMNSNTHLGLSDIPMISHIPNLVYLAPTNKQEYLAMFKYATSQKEHPIAIRLPGSLYETDKEDLTDYSVINKSEVVKKGKDVAIIAVGSFFKIGREIVEQYKNKTGKDITLINPKFLTGLDTKLLKDLESEHRLVITLEDGILDGGFGQTVAGFYGTDDMLVKNYGIEKGFPSEYVPEDLMKENGISVDQIIADIEKLLK